jgi:DNA-binding Xre family transcriptional regulator
MKWNLRLAAANRGIWKASEMQRLLAERGLVMSAGKLSGLWSGHPNSIKLDELEIFCAVLDCSPDELLIREPSAVPVPAPPQNAEQAAAADSGATIRPRKPQRRTPPPA